MQASFRTFASASAATLMALTVLAACQRKDANVDDAGTASDQVVPPPAATASATIRSASGVDLGTLTLTEAPGGITVTGSLKGLPPGTRAFHLHTVGICEAPFTSAGPHWNPTNASHGSDNPAGPHFGDMMNITVAADSTVTINTTTPGGAFSGDQGLLDADGGALVIHAGSDDYKTDPAGNAGDRIACGVVTRG